MTSLEFNFFFTPNAVTLEVRASAYEFGGDTIQSIGPHY
jgi:hypothetical protein